MEAACICNFSAQLPMSSTLCTKHSMPRPKKAGSSYCSCQLAAGALPPSSELSPPSFKA